MKLKLTKNQFTILTSLNGVTAFISEKFTENDNVVFEVPDISGFQDEIYFNIVEDGMDREGQVNNNGKELYSIYDALLAQM